MLVTTTGCVYNVDSIDPLYVTDELYMLLRSDMDLRTAFIDKFGNCYVERLGFSKGDKFYVLCEEAKIKDFFETSERRYVPYE